MNVYGRMTEAERKAEEMRKKDAEILARRKQKFDAARFDHIEKTNKVHGQPKPHPAPEQPTKPDKEPEESKRKGWRIFKKKNKESEKELVKESTKPMFTVKPPPPIAAGSVKPNVFSTPHEVTPNWATVDQQNQSPQPDVGHSSDACYPRPAFAPKIPTHKASEPPKKEPNKPKYNTVGYGTGKKSGTSISDTIAAFQTTAIGPKVGGPRKMAQPKVESSTSESMDARGNITRTITRKITELDGKMRTETEVVEIPAKR